MKDQENKFGIFPHHLLGSRDPSTNKPLLFFALYPKEAQGLHYPSMHQDYTNGRLTEIDYLNGQIAAYGKTFNISTPINAMLTHLVHQLESKLQ